MKHLIVIAFLLTGCDAAAPQQSMMPVCPVDTGPRAAWIVDCARAANPLSDEEGEDLVAQCETTSKRLFCPAFLHEWQAVRGYWKQIEP